MAWDGAPDGWRPPAEQKAAAEGAEKFEAERAAADARTQAIADAIAFGFDRVAMAIVAAAGDDAEQRWHDMNRPDDFDPQPTPTAVAMQRIQAEHAAAVRAADERDDDLNDLLADGEDHDPNG